MFPSSRIVDPQPEAALLVLASLDWNDSLDAAETEGIDPLFGEVLDDPFHDLELELQDLIQRECRAHEAALTPPMRVWSDEALVDEAARLERLDRFNSARSYAVINELARRRPAPSGDPEERGLSAYAVDEIAVVTGVTRFAACRKVAEADALASRHPGLLAALAAGCVSRPAINRVLETTAVLSPEDCVKLERQLLTRIGRPVVAELGELSPESLAVLSTETVMAISAKATTSYVGRVARTLASRLDPAATARREVKAKSGRMVKLEMGLDGMAWLTIHAPAALAAAAYERVDEIAHSLPTDADPETGEVDARSMDAKRADVACDLLFGARIEPDGTVTGPAPVHVHVTVDSRGVASTKGTIDELPGSGEIGEVGRLGKVSSATIRELLDLADRSDGIVDGAHATEQTCPGADVHQLEGPGPYTPPEPLKRFLRVQHRVCVFPGCQRAARHCELDHTVRHPDGPTCRCNLAPLCVHHHHLKHKAPGWRLVNHGDGRLTWFTPTGRRIEVGPDGGDPPSPVDCGPDHTGPAPPDEVPPF